VTRRGESKKRNRLSVGARASAGSYWHLPPLEGKAATKSLLIAVHAAGYPSAKCAPVTAHWLQIFPPNQTVPIYLHFTSTACAKPVKLLTVDVVVPGSGG